MTLKYFQGMKLEGLFSKGNKMELYILANGAKEQASYVHQYYQCLVRGDSDGNIRTFARGYSSTLGFWKHRGTKLVRRV